MTFQVEAKRVKAGQSLTDLHNQAISAIAQIGMIKTNLLNLKSSVDSDADYAIDDGNAVQTIITDIANRVKGL